jgi:hypothetical protein
VRQGERGHTALGQPVQPSQAPGQVVRGEPVAEDVAALHGVDDRRLARGPNPIQLDV